MKNFITLLFITLTFNCFSQTVLVYDRINDFEKEINLNEIDTVYIILGLEYYDENEDIYYFDQYSANYHGVSKYTLTKPNLKYIPILNEKYVLKEDTFYIEQNYVYESYIESNSMVFIEDDTKINNNNNIVKVFCRIDDNFLGRKSKDSKIKMEILDMNRSDYRSYIKNKVKNAIRNSGIAFDE